MFFFAFCSQLNDASAFVTDIVMFVFLPSNPRQYGRRVFYDIAPVCQSQVTNDGQL